MPRKGSNRQHHTSIIAKELPVSYSNASSRRQQQATDRRDAILAHRQAKSESRRRSEQVDEPSPLIADYDFNTDKSDAHKTSEESDIIDTPFGGNSDEITALMNSNISPLTMDSKSCFPPPISPAFESLGTTTPVQKRKKALPKKGSRKDIQQREAGKARVRGNLDTSLPLNPQPDSDPYRSQQLESNPLNPISSITDPPPSFVPSHAPNSDRPHLNSPLPPPPPKGGLVDRLVHYFREEKVLLPNGQSLLSPPLPLPLSRPIHVSSVAANVSLSLASRAMPSSFSGTGALAASVSPPRPCLVGSGSLPSLKDKSLTSCRKVSFSPEQPAIRIIPYGSGSRFTPPPLSFPPSSPERLLSLLKAEGGLDERGSDDIEEWAEEDEEEEDEEEKKEEEEEQGEEEEGKGGKERVRTVRGSCGSNGENEFKICGESSCDDSWQKDGFSSPQMRKTILELAVENLKRNSVGSHSQPNTNVSIFNISKGESENEEGKCVENFQESSDKDLKAKSMNREFYECNNIGISESNSKLRYLRKKILISNLPPFLIINLPHYMVMDLKNSPQNTFHASSSFFTPFPLILDLDPFLSKDPAFESSDEENNSAVKAFYSLMAVVAHEEDLVVKGEEDIKSGKAWKLESVKKEAKMTKVASNGHYVAYVKRLKKLNLKDTAERGEACRGEEEEGGELIEEKENEEEVWYYTSDDEVREATVEEVMTSNAYILLYGKCKSRLNLSS